MTQTSNSRQGRVSLITFLLVLGLFTAAFSKMILPYFMSIMMGGILGLLANPIYQRLCRKIGARASAVITTVSVIFLVVAPLLSFAGLAVKQGVTVAQWVTESDGFSVSTILEHITKFGPIETLIGDPTAVVQQLRSSIQSLGRGATSFILAMAKSIPDGILQIFLASLTCFFFLMDGRRFLRWLGAKIPLEQDVRMAVAAAFQDTAIGAIWASMAAAGTQALIMLIAFLVLGVPGAFLAGGVTFIFAWIPILGSTPVWLVGAAYLYFRDSIPMVTAMIAFGIITGLVDNFVRPWVLKGRGEMHPLLSLVAIFGGIQMFGLPGLFLGPILAAIVVSLLQIWPVVGERFGLQFPEVESPPRSDTSKGSEGKSGANR